jgi:SOS-response transcriptional repressor LexA
VECPRCSQQFQVPGENSEPDVVVDESAGLTDVKVKVPSNGIALSDHSENGLTMLADSDFDAKLSTLTQRQRDIYDYIRDRIEVLGFPPSVREIGDQFGISSPNGVMSHLKALEKKGFIERDPQAARSIRLLGAPTLNSPVTDLLDSSMLTARQLDIFEFICICVDTNGFSPTVREIGEKFQITSPNGVACHLQALVKKGFIRRHGSSARGLQILGRVTVNTQSNLNDER